MNGEDIFLIASTHAHTKPYFGGVYSADTIPSPSPNFSQFYIVNTDFMSGEGKHWVMIFMPANCLHYEWFDPLGKLPSNYNQFLHSFMTKNEKQSFIMNAFPVQSKESDKCGMFCLTLADLRSQNLSFENSLAMFFSKDIQKNDSIVQQYVNKHMKSNA